MNSLVLRRIGRSSFRRIIFYFLFPIPYLPLFIPVYAALPYFALTHFIPFYFVLYLFYLFYFILLEDSQNTNAGNDRGPHLPERHRAETSSFSSTRLRIKVICSFTFSSHIDGVTVKNCRYLVVINTNMERTALHPPPFHNIDILCTDHRRKKRD